jgi:hypothetical protein
LFRRKGKITAKQSKEPAVRFNAVRIGSAGAALSAVTLRVGSVFAD